MNDGYKEVRVGPKRIEIPKDWSLETFSDVISTLESGGRPKTDERSENDSVLSIGGAHISSEGEFKLSEPVRISEEYYSKMNSGKIKKRDILLVKDGATIGKSLFVDDIPENKAAVNSHVYKIRAGNGHSARFIYYFISSKIGFNQINRLTTGSAQAGLNKGFTNIMKVPLPSLPEQRRIAEILSTVDEAIQKTDKVIEKAKRLKKGLMQDLLTKGIGHDEFKEVQIGPRFIKVPKEWNIKDLQPSNGIVKKVTDGSHYSPSQVEDGEYLYATVSNFSDNGIDYRSCNKINEEEYLKMVEGGNKPQKGDVLFSKDGTIGITDVFNDGEDVVLLSSIAIIRPIQNQINPLYLKYFLSSEEIKHQIRSFKSGSAIRRVVLRDIKKFEIPVPPLPEQRRIAEILSNVDSKIQKEKSYKQKLQKLKRGLMQDLLTGKVRVNV